MAGYMATSASDEWSTPQDLYDSLNAEFAFTLDVCASEANAKHHRYLSKEQDALLTPWKGDVCWMNPPHSLLREFLQKAHREAVNGATVVCLIPARTDTQAWHDCAMQANRIRLIKGRLTFGGAPASAPFPSALVIFRRYPDPLSVVSCDRLGRPLPERLWAAA